MSTKKRERKEKADVAANQPHKASPLPKKELGTITEHLRRHLLSRAGLDVLLSSQLAGAENI